MAQNYSFDADTSYLVHNDLLQNSHRHQEGDEEECIIRTVKDRYHLVKITFFLIGLSQLLPWNFFVAATSYWMYKFREVNSSSFGFELIPEYFDTKTNTQRLFDSYLSIASNAPVLFVFIINYINCLQFLGEKRRNVMLFSVMITVFAVINSFVLINTDQIQSQFLLVTLVLVFALNFVASYLQAVFAGLVSLFPIKCMHLMVAGQAMSGVFASAAQLLILLGGWSVVTSTFGYFMLANLTVLFTFALYWYITDTDYFRLYTTITTDVNSSGGDQQVEANWETYRSIFFKMWPFCISLTMIFWITLALYPSVVVLVRFDPNFFIPEKFFLPICTFLAFNLCDFLGRYLGKFALLSPNRPFLLLAITAMRVVFVPLILFTNVQHVHLTTLFYSPYVYTLFIVMLGLSNGYCVLNVFVNGPATVELEHRQISGYFLIFFLGLGLTLGSLTSNFLVRIL